MLRSYTAGSKVVIDGPAATMSVVDRDPRSVSRLSKEGLGLRLIASDSFIRSRSVKRRASGLVLDQLRKKLPCRK
jgi:hypothetical protein